MPNGDCQSRQSDEKWIKTIEQEQTSQQPRVRQFCVDIAHSFIWRNIDAELLREHSVRRYCAYYKVCKFCVISSFASTLALKLRKKNKKKLHAQKRKKIACAKKSAPGFEPGISHFKAATLPTEPPRFCCIHRFSSCPIYIQDTILAQFLCMRRRMRRNCAIFLRNCAYCAKVGADVQNCALKNHYSAPHIKGFRRLGLLLCSKNKTRKCMVSQNNLLYR